MVGIDAGEMVGCVIALEFVSSDFLGDCPLITREFDGG